ncbi:MAG: nucleotidyltransferase family protein, partial [Deltaproteobacteria bacterium]
VTRIVANAHYLSDQIEAHLAGTGVEVIVETPDVLETGGGLRNALPLIGSAPVFVMNTDAVFTGHNPLITLANQWDAERMDALHLVVPLAHASGYAGNGDWAMDSENRLSRGRDFIYSSAQITTTARLIAVRQQQFSLNVIWDAMIADQRLFGVVHDGGWCDVGRPESIALAEALLKSGHV